MTTLDNGIVIDESVDAVHITRAADCPNVFGGRERLVTGVTLHHWGNKGQDFYTVRGYLASDNDRESSAHFVLQEDLVSCIVSPDDVAWHAGNAEGNASTIGIECRPEMTEGDLATLESLIRYLESIYGDLAVYVHSEWINTSCPGNYLTKRDEIVERVNNAVPSAIVVPVVAPIPADAPVQECHCHVGNVTVNVEVKLGE
jgi:N-acetylmuramoyl-L-alanine amidase